MKEFIPVLAVAIFLTWGCQKTVETKTQTKAAREKAMVEQIYERYMKDLGRGGFTIRDPKRPFMLFDKVNIELTYANYKASERLRESIEKFNESSTTLARRMLNLTIVMAFLVLTQIVIMIMKR